MILQPISIKKNVNYYDLALNFNFGYSILLSYLFILFMVTLFCLLISRLTIKIDGRFRRKSLISKCVILFEHLFGTSFLPINIMLLFLSLFFWFTQLFLTNNIKTNKVVIDTFDLIKNTRELLNTKKVVCFLNRDTEMNLAINSPKNTILSKLFHEKTRLRDDQVKEKLFLNNQHCLMKLDVKMAEMLKSDILLVISKVESNFHLMLYAEVGFPDKIWIFNKNIQLYNVVTYYNERNSINKFEFEKR